MAILVAVGTGFRCSFMRFSTTLDIAKLFAINTGASRCGRVQS